MPPVIRTERAQYVGVTPMPEILPGADSDPKFLQAARRKPVSNRVMQVPRDLRDFKDPPNFLATRRLPALEGPGDRPPVLARDVHEANMQQREFGVGYFTQFRSERPPTGIQLLRPFHKVPVDPRDMEMGMGGGASTWGEYNRGYRHLTRHDLKDPRYKKPVFRTKRNAEEGRSTQSRKREKRTRGKVEGLGMVGASGKARRLV